MARFDAWEGDVNFDRDDAMMCATAWTNEIGRIINHSEQAIAGRNLLVARELLARIRLYLDRVERALDRMEDSDE